MDERVLSPSAEDREILTHIIIWSDLITQWTGRYPQLAVERPGYPHIPSMPLFLLFDLVVPGLFYLCFCVINSLRSSLAKNQRNIWLSM